MKKCICGKEFANNKQITILQANNKRVRKSTLCSQTNYHFCSFS